MSVRAAVAVPAARIPVPPAAAPIRSDSLQAVRHRVIRPVAKLSPACPGPAASRRRGPAVRAAESRTICKADCRTSADRPSSGYQNFRQTAFRAVGRRPDIVLGGRHAGGSLDVIVVAALPVFAGLAPLLFRARVMSELSRPWRWPVPLISRVARLQIVALVVVTRFPGRRRGLPPLQVQLPFHGCAGKVTQQPAVRQDLLRVGTEQGLINFQLKRATRAETTVIRLADFLVHVHDRVSRWFSGFRPRPGRSRPRQSVISLDQVRPDSVQPPALPAAQGQQRAALGAGQQSAAGRGSRSARVRAAERGAASCAHQRSADCRRQFVPGSIVVALRRPSEGIIISSVEVRGNFGQSRLERGDFP